MGFRIASDSGGTFTDVVISDEDGRLFVGKSPTTKDRIFDGLNEALEMAAEEMQLELKEILRQCDLFVYATTHATNAMLTRDTAKTAFLTTAGFPDTLTIRQGGKESAYDFRQPYPAPYIPRRLTFEVKERVSAAGEVIVPLDRTHAATTLDELNGRNIEAVAVCLINAVANPEHELELAELIKERLPEIPYTLSTTLNPIVGEYRRASSTAIDASLKPLMQRHLRDVYADLRATGFDGELLVASSFGGAMHIEDVIDKPIYTVKSGPALAPVAGREYAAAEGYGGDTIVADTGGTSFDVSLLRDGNIKFTRDTWLGPRFTGDLTGLSSVDIRSVGAGGGSIAWVDSGGLLRVGPQSAGAVPGPVCYGRGGEKPTVTDAAVVLGYIDPDFFLSGRMPLDAEASRRAFGSLAEELGLPLREAAFGVMALASERMVLAIQDITINEGVDPRESGLVAGGGAAGLNIGQIARELGCRWVLIPSIGAVFSASGGHYSDIVSEVWRTHRFVTDNQDYSGVNRVLDELDSSLDEVSERLRTRGFTSFKRSYSIEARYPGQFWELDVELNKNRIDSESDVELLKQSVGAAHERIFAVEGEGEVECLVWTARITAQLEKPASPILKSNGQDSFRPQIMRDAYFRNGTDTQVPVYREEFIHANQIIEGPALIEGPLTTIVIDPESTVRRTDNGHYFMEFVADPVENTARGTEGSSQRDHGAHDEA